MSCFGNGFLAYHVEVRVTPGQAEAVKADVKRWKSEVREATTWPGFPGTLQDRLRSLPGVIDVTCEGPQSAVLIPLRMMQVLTGCPCAMSSTLGTGPIASAIEQDLVAWGIDRVQERRLVEADSPLEFSFRDGCGPSASLVLYPVSRRRYQARLGPVEIMPTHLLLNRYNQGLSDLAERVAGAGGIVSFRPRELGRHDSLKDWIDLLAHSHHVAISSRHDTMRKFAIAMGIRLPRGWPETNMRLQDRTFQQLAVALSECMPAGAIVMLHRYSLGDTLFHRSGWGPVIVPAPQGYGAESRMARLQGSLLAMTTLDDVGDNQDRGELGWQQTCQNAVRLAWQGTQERPWQYPVQER